MRLPRPSVERSVGPFALVLALMVVVLAAVALAWPGIRRTNERTRIGLAHRDAELISRALVRFYGDNGFFPLWERRVGDDDEQGRIDVLVGDGPAPAAPAGSPWLTARTDTLANQLITNTPRYPARSGVDESGWGGPYLAAPPGSDPWNHRYVVNIGLVLVAGAPKWAVWVLSAGPNGVIETPYKQLLSSAALGGDDVGVRVQ